MEQTNYKNNDLIDLRELIQTLKMRKKFIFSIIASITLLAILYAFLLAKPVYEVKAMIEIGKINAGSKDEVPLDDLQDVKQKLEYIHGVHAKTKREFPRIKTISIPTKSKSFFYVTVESRDNASAITYIDTITRKLENDYTQKINAHVNTQKELLNLTQNDILLMQKNLSTSEELLKNYSQRILDITEKDAALAGLYSMQISDIQLRVQDLQTRISELKTNEYNLKLSLSPLKIRNTSIIGEIEISEKPIKPKKILIVIVAFITSIMLSIFLVFFLAFIKGFREEV